MLLRVFGATRIFPLQSEAIPSESFTPVQLYRETEVHKTSLTALPVEPLAVVTVSSEDSIEPLSTSPIDLQLGDMLDDATIPEIDGFSTDLDLKNILLTVPIQGVVTDLPLLVRNDGISELTGSPDQIIEENESIPNIIIDYIFEFPKIQ